MAALPLSARDHRQQSLDLPPENDDVVVRPLRQRRNALLRIDNFSGGAVCLVLASDRYREADYIRTYDEFLAHVRNQPRSAKAKGSAAIGP